MRLRVEMNAASPRGQRVMTEDGEMIEGVKEVKWAANAVDRPMVILELFAERVEFDLANTQESAEEGSSDEAQGA